MDDWAVIQPKRGKTESAIPPLAVMVATEPDLTSARRAFGCETQPLARIVSSRVFSGGLASRAVTVTGPVLGAPHGAMVLEKLIVLGATKVLFLGWCGSLQGHVKIGDLVLPGIAVVGEGTSQYYGDAARPHASAALLGALRRGCRDRDATPHEGPVWSTDAPYRETKDRVLALKAEGVLGVDMEVSALFNVAGFRGIDLGALLVVSDELGALAWNPGFSSLPFKAGRKTALQVTEAAGRILLEEGER